MLHKYLESSTGIFVTSSHLPSSAHFVVRLEVRELSLERNHRVSAVWHSNATEGRDGSWDLVGTKESEETELGQAAVIQLSNQATFLGRFVHVLVEAKGVIQVEDGVDGITELSERGVLSRLAAVGIMGKVTSTTFIPELKCRDEGKDLPLGTNRDGIPLLFRRQVSGRVGSSGKSLRPWEDDVGLDNVSYKGEHGNTAVLNRTNIKPVSSKQEKRNADRLL
jgi:hypothetical protein